MNRPLHAYRAEPDWPRRAVPELSRVLGNQMHKRFLDTGVIQAKLRVSQPRDADELEADRVADTILRMPASGGCVACTAGTTPRSSCEEKDSVRRMADGAVSAPDVSAQALALPDAGAPLPRSARDFFEPRFGRDFGDVRVHTGARSAASARSVAARAYTYGRHLVFDTDQYAPQSAQGRRLLAHELTHVVQQSNGAGPALQRQPAEPGVCDPANLGTLGPAFRKPESAVQALGLTEKYLRRPTVGEEDYVLYCPHRSTRPLKRLVACTKVYWVGDAEAAGKGRGKDEVWAQQEGETDLYWGYVKKDKICDAFPQECARQGTTTVERARPSVPSAPLKLGIHAQRTGPDTTMGHASVSLTDGAGTRKAWGFYPECTDCSSFSLCSTGQSLEIVTGIWVNGKVCDDTNLWPSTTFEYTITPAQYAAALKETGKYHGYNLFDYNCVDFVRTVAGAAGVTVPDFPGIDEPDEFADDIDQRIFDAGGYAIRSHQGDPVDLTKPQPTFSITGLPPQHTLWSRWVISDLSDNRYLMSSDTGPVKHYQQSFKTFIPNRTRQKLQDDGVTEADVLCRVKPALFSSDNNLVALRVRFAW